MTFAPKTFLLSFLGMKSSRLPTSEAVFSAGIQFSFTLQEEKKVNLIIIIIIYYYFEYSQAAMQTKGEQLTGYQSANSWSIKTPTELTQRNVIKPK